LRLATKKFRAFGINWGNEWSTKEQTVTIHAHGWVPVVVPLNTDGFLKYLGRNIDMHLSGGEAEVQITQYCQNALTYVCKRRSSADTKLLTIKLCVIPKVVYLLKFLAWPLAKYDQLERKFASSYRRITKNKLSFPTGLLYVSVQNGGMGLPSIVDAAQKAKLALAIRGLSREYTRHSMSGLLARGIEYTGNVVKVNIRTRAVGEHWVDSCWSRSLIEWGQRAGILLVAEGVRVNGGEQTIAEVLVQEGRKISEAQFLKWMSQGQATRHDLDEETRERTEVFLRVGQCWSTVEQLKYGEMMEILVLDADMVDYLIWRTEDKVLAVGAVIKLSIDEFSLGAGTRARHAESHREFVQRLNAENAIQIITTGDKHWRQTCGRCTKWRLGRGPG
jgi:hypothetical protein